MQGPKVLDQPSLLPQPISRELNKVEQVGLKLVAIRDASSTGQFLACYATALAQRTLIMFNTKIILIQCFLS